MKSTIYYKGPDEDDDRDDDEEGCPDYDDHDEDSWP